MIFLAALMSIQLICISLSKTVAAETTWSAGTPTVVDSQPVNQWPFAGCPANHQLRKQSRIAGTLEATDICSTQGGPVSFAVHTQNRGAVSFSNEIQMYAISNMACTDNQACTYLPDTDTFIEKQYINYYAVKMVIYEQFSHRLSPTSNPNTLSTEYSFNRDNPNFVFQESDGTIRRVKTFGISENSRWLIAELEGIAIVRIDLKTYDVVKFSDLRTNYWYAGPNLEYSITNDGKHVAMMGSNASAVIYDIDDSCTRKVTPQDSQYDVQVYLAKACPYAALWMPEDLFIERFKFAYFPKFLKDGNEINFLVTSYNGDAKSVTLRAPIYEETPTLTYLALGDSYSSGEGDTGTKPGGGNYYTPMTDYNGGCHISERSYPFLLRDAYSISPSNMHSVACSGAQVVPDYTSRVSSYLGQGGRLERYNDTDRLSYQAKALEKYIPGNTPQIEFVRKYQPDVITLTGGGNDIGFADILKYCATPTWEGGFVDSTCGYAVSGSELERLLYSSIDTQYLYTIRLLSNLKATSPSTRVIMIGYPSFIAEGSLLPCALNGGTLNNRERNMMNRAVAYMNSMLQRAAYDSGVSYVDVEDSLRGGRICDGGAYVTGLHNLGYNKLINRNLDESFHPNASGHRLIAQKIQSSKALTDAQQQSAGSYVPSHQQVNSQQQQIITDSSVLRASQNVNIKVQPYSFQPTSLVTVTAFSEHIDLGTLISTSSGGLDGQLDMSEVPIGRHVLLLSGRTFSGESVNYYQFIEVRESPTDADGDGISDVHDPCTFIAHWYDELQNKDVCAIEDISDEPTSYAVSNKPIDYNLKISSVDPPTRLQSTLSTNSGERSSEDDKNTAVLGSRDFKGLPFSYSDNRNGGIIGESTPLWLIATVLGSLGGVYVFIRFIKHFIKKKT